MAKAKFDRNFEVICPKCGTRLGTQVKAELLKKLESFLEDLVWERKTEGETNEEH